MNKILDFKTEKAEVLTLDELYSSCKLKNADGKHIVEPHRVFADTVELLNKHNITYDMLPIIAKGGTHALYNEDLAGYIGVDHDIRAYTLLRTSGIITMPSYSDNETTMQIRLDVTERGITLSTGKLVLVCTNGMTAFKGDLISTYGQGKIQYEHALQVVENWVQGLEQKNAEYNRLIEKLKAVKVNESSVKTMIGKLMYQAVDGNINNYVAPLNVTQVSSFTNALIERERNTEDDHLNIHTGWDLYNLGTDLFKHDNMDMTIIAERNFAFTNFMMKDFCLEVEDAHVF